MTEMPHFDENVLLHHPEVRRVIDPVNRELEERLQYRPPVCPQLKDAMTRLTTAAEFRFDIHPESAKQLPKIIDNVVQRVLPAKEDSEGGLASRRRRRIGIVFSGGPSPGGHNVIGGLFDAAKAANPENEVVGFLMGPDGIIESMITPMTDELVDRYRNLGGFSMIKTGRTKIDTEEKMHLSRETCRQLQLDAVVVVGGDDSNTNAAFLAQELFSDGVQVIGVPKTIDGDIQVRDAEGQSLCAVSFGFHTAAAAFARNISNLCTDAASDVKYWHICKVMGRVASHLALEVGLQTHPTMVLIGEDLADYVDERRLFAAEEKGEVDYSAYGMTLRHLSRVICDTIVQRAAVGKNYGVLVIPEGVLEFINEIQVFIIKLSTVIADYNRTHDRTFHEDYPVLDSKLDYLRRMARDVVEEGRIGIWNQRDNDLFDDIPDFFKEGLLMERDSHGNFQFSQVETDKIIMGLVKDYLHILKDKGLYKVGIDRIWFERTLRRDGLDPEVYGPVIFKNFDTADCQLVRESIISVKTLTLALEKAGLLEGSGAVPKAVLKVFKRSEPDFKMQPHFYGYDGRGNDPTTFDCNYTYNLGRTVFALIAGGATGQMAAIRNLEKEFSDWEPIGIPIAPLMHLEDRKGKLALVLEKSVVDVRSPSFLVAKGMREAWLAAAPGEDPCRRPDPARLSPGNGEKPLTLTLNALAGSLTD